MNFLHSWCLRCFTDSPNDQGEANKSPSKEDSSKVYEVVSSSEKPLEIEIESVQLDKTHDQIMHDSKSSEMNSPSAAHEIKISNGNTIEIKIKRSKRKKRKVTKHHNEEQKESEVIIKSEKKKRISFADNTEPPHRRDSADTLPQRRMARFKTMVSSFKDQSPDVLKIRSFIKSFGSNSAQAQQQQQVPNFLEHL
ncbi:unnamed protein product [Blepharisma stoltei]|uniref:Uncharacterized protein n=1 Tax=Blepharisma stoltei TaxID=1481888 RepID=A0AAU9JGA9_9CILI|nr:unnamed protein product [Blepharisma stoltei]